MKTILLIIAIVFAIVVYFGTALSKNENKRMSFIVLWLFLTGVLFFTCVILNSELNHYKSQAEGKCPEYERIENVYKLK
jgi:phosphoglycerol transferase MdoB-like AlkP superfamily enzyme